MEVTPKVIKIKTADEAGDIPGFIRKFKSGIVSADAAFNLARREKSAVVYWLSRANRAYYYIAEGKKQ